MKEFIVCAAIWVNDGKYYPQQPVNIPIGFVKVGKRHSDCRNVTNQQKPLKKNPNKKSIREMIEWGHCNEQGFITSLNRYVDRNEAWEIALENNQIINRSAGGNSGILTTENYIK